MVDADVGIMSTTPVSSKRMPPARSPDLADQTQEIAREAYVYAYPLVLMGVTLQLGTNVAVPQGSSAPVNQLAHVREFPDPSFTIVVRPNADTLYSVLTFDVSAEPLVISVPDSRGRYYLHEWLDHWTDVFASPGSRTTGDAAQTYAIVGPAWTGKLPEGVRAYRSPTARGLLIGRAQTNGKSDYEAVHEFQDGMRAVPLSAFGKPYSPPRGDVNPKLDTTAPPIQVAKMDARTFFATFTALLQGNPPHANDYPILDRMRRIGIEPGKRFDVAAAPRDVREAFEAAVRTERERIETVMQRSGTIANGWRINRTAIGTYGTDFLRRAGIAFAGLGANVVQDALYPTAFTDADGDPLDSRSKYVLHFEPGQLPPVNAFWSLTMYDERQLFSANAIDRFAIGDRDALKLNPDGSLTLYIQRETPGRERESNWLPTPSGGTFTMNLRLYWPKEAATDGAWLPPPVKRLG